MQALVKMKMIDISDSVYLLADYSKFGTQAFSKIAPIEAIDYIITDDKTSNAQLEAFADLSIKVIKG